VFAKWQLEKSRTICFIKSKEEVMNCDIGFFQRDTVAITPSLAIAQTPCKAKFA